MPRSYALSVAKEAHEGAARGTAGTLERTDAPSLDPEAIRRSYQHHRARREARKERVRRSRWAGARFWVVLLLLVAACVLLAMTTWHEIGRLFGL